MTHPGEPPTTPAPDGPSPGGPAPQPVPVAHPYVPPTSWPPPAAPAYGGWTPQQYPPAQPYASAVGQDPAQALRKARTALGWAIGAAVGAFLAMGLAVLALLVGSGLDEDLFYESLRGEVVGLSDGSALAGARLERPLVDLLSEYTADVPDVRCPDTASVTVSTAVVCTGEVDGFAWTGVVYFEDAEGHFVVLEL